VPSLWLVDGSHAIFRAYHALPHLSTRQGVPTNAVYGFTTMLMRAIREGNPTHLAVAFDEAGKQARSEIYAEYKATRGAPPEDLTPQFPLVRRVLEPSGCPRWNAGLGSGRRHRHPRPSRPGFARLGSGGGDRRTRICCSSWTGASAATTACTRSGYGPAEVEEKWGVPPHLVADLPRADRGQDRQRAGHPWSG